jgi:hypothetical protein
MFLSKKLIIFAVMGLILGGLSSYSVNAATLYDEGSLLRAEGGSTIYYVGPDQTKYVFPEAKTYGTWYDDFSNVEEVNLEELDKYDDGGMMPVRGGTRLVTHPDTAKIYAIEPGGVARHIPSAVIAKKLFGDKWYEQVIDVLPGFFITTYKLGQQLEDKLPNGYVVAEEGGDNYFYIENGKKKSLSTEAFQANKFKSRYVYRIRNIDDYEDDGEAVESKKSLANFVPFLKDVNDKKVLVCHYPLGNNDNARTLSVSKNALSAHLKNGSTLGRCTEVKDDIDDPEPDPEPDPGTEPSTERWCSVLMGMFTSDSLGYTSANIHAVLDINGDDNVSLADLSLMTDMHANGQHAACYDQIVSNYDENNYEELDWCNGLVQGITDLYANQAASTPGIFDLNGDDVLNLSDVALVAQLKYEADQSACYVHYVPPLTKMMNDDDDEEGDPDVEISETCNDDECEE